MAAEYLNQLFGLTSQTAIVTGGTGGLGSALVLALVRAGCSSIISIELPSDPLSSELKTQVEAAGGSLRVFKCDLRNASSIRECFNRIWAEGFEAGILLNCAGVMRRNLCEASTDEELDLVS